MFRAFLVVLVVLAGACGAAPAAQPAPTGSHWWETASVPPQSLAGADATAPQVATVVAPSLVTPYRETAARILDAAVRDRGAYDKLRQLTDQIGARLSGSPQLDQAIAWAVKTLTADGHPVHTEKVMVPHWDRGFEAAQIVAPIKRDLVILGLGNTIATPRGGVTAPLVVVHSVAELDEKKDRVKGAIVLFDAALPAWSEEKGSGYGDLGTLRRIGPAEAAKRGAVGVLFRSITARSLRTPHTGATDAKPAGANAPAAAVTIEDAALLARLAEQGPVTVKLVLSGRMLPDAPSANVIAELRGREKPDEIVLLGAHLDSWDVGQGAHDDGAGVVQVMQALTTLKKLGAVPRRTIRVVLYTNEENGLRGGLGYFEAHQAEASKHVLAVETDSGGFAPRGFGVEATDPAMAERLRSRLADVVELLEPIGATQIQVGHSGADISPLVKAGVAGAGLWTVDRNYFDYHHTPADTLDKVDPAELAADVAALAVLAYVVADLPGRIDQP